MRSRAGRRRDPCEQMLRQVEDVDLDTQLNVFEDEALTDEEAVLDNWNLDEISMGYPHRSQSCRGPASGAGGGGRGEEETDRHARMRISSAAFLDLASGSGERAVVVGAVITSPEEIVQAVVKLLKDTDAYPFFARTMQDLLLVPGPRRRR